MRIIEFDDVTINPAKLEIRKAGALVDVEPKSFRVLEYLIAHRERVVAKDELIEKVWDGTFVTDSAITRVIAQLRKAIGDDARQARYIETVPTIGYRFIARVVDELPATPVVSPAPPPDPTPVPPPPGMGEGPRKINWFVPVGALAAIILAWFMPYIKQWTASRSTTGPTAPRTQQFTTSKGLDMHPNFSPDGSAVVYASDKSGRFEIYVKQIASGSEIAITTGGKDSFEPAWSPDGATIAYTQHQSRGIYLVPALGGIPRKLTSFGSQPAWSPDSKRIVFRSEGITTPAFPETQPGTASALWTIDAQGSEEPQPLTKPNEPAGRHTEPAFSPAGRYLAFLSIQPRRQAILWELDLTTGKMLPVTNEDPLPTAFAYAANGASIYMIGLSRQDGTGLYRVRRDPGTRAISGQPELLTRIDFMQIRDLHIHPASNRLAYAATRMTSNLHQVKPSTGESSSLIDEITYRISMPSFSPTGDRIAYVLRQEGALGDIWVANADGSRQTRVTNHPGPDFMASWAPDGQSLFYGSIRNGKESLVRFSFADGSERTVADLTGARGMLRLSPNASTIAFGDDHTTLIDIASGTRRKLLDAAGYACWSPDSRTLAVEIRKGDDTHVGIVPATGGTLRQLTNRPGHAWPFSFSPDGRQIAVAATWSGAWNIWAIDAQSGEGRQITRNELQRIFVRYPEWSPSGTPIVYENNETRGNLYLTEPLQP
jgi:Tol biopolymer transport system component/DNA-binding winged helix-turn-helix (wHTH) protein